MKIINDLFKYKENYDVCGLTKELGVLYIVNYFNTHDENVVVLTNSLYEANNYFKSISTYLDEVLFFPMDDFLTSVAIAVSPDLKLKRLETLEKLKSDNKKHIIVTSLMGYLKFLPSLNEEHEFEINLQKNISREIILKKLCDFGYNRESIVTTTGEYAVRGYIIDIFPTQSEHPVRLEFFGSELETLKEFDEDTQLSLKRIDKCVIKKFDERITSSSASLLDYTQNQTVFMVDKNQINIAYKKLINEMFEYKVSKGIDSNTKYMFDFEEIKYKKAYYLETINNYENDNSLVYNSKELINFNSDFNSLKTFCLKELKTKTIIFALQNDKQVNIIEEIFKDVYITNSENILINKINIIRTKLNRGFMLDKYVVITPFDIENIKTNPVKYKNTIKIGKKIKSFNDLKIGDYIVHEMHGIGIYKGLKTLKSGGFERDYIELEYMDCDKVYVQVEHIDKLYKYTHKYGTSPKLTKLNSTTWAKKKREARKRIRDISEELLRLYSSREKIVSDAYKDYDEELEFAMNFPYSLTLDQQRSIKEISLDLKSTSPMDRLLCGDVGYGKTEVAFRAMFKTVMNGFQVAYLCPTTILSKQQYSSALERFKDFPIRIELLNRHVPQKKVTQIFEDLKKGKVDIVIGTHKLLNKELKYKRLGLLVIDEEQRFGVTHKEKIKSLKMDVNVLTLSATPIPRTLKMAMSGLRSLSILDTPPINRYPIQTYVIEENELLIRDAIYKEMTRGGQVFVLINNIEDMSRVGNKIQKIVPEAKVAIAHGKMVSNEMDGIMEKFIDGFYDVLVCTTIIETGIDIPNVNTIIILEADRFGLSQLYQIRGRVGRSDKIAYAYLMYNPTKFLNETATKRLDSIKEFTELGSGYKIAMRDLTIRGAGDLLGMEQAGFVDAIGLDLYTKMVNEEVQRLNGLEINEEIKKSTTLNIDTHIGDDYVSEESLKIEIHKLINSIKTDDDLLNIKMELEDRFGKIPESIEIYMVEKCIENLFDILDVKTVTQAQKKISITFTEEISSKMNGEKLFLKAYNINPKFEISYKEKKVSIALKIDNQQKKYIYDIYELLNFINTQICVV